MTYTLPQHLHDHITDEARSLNIDADRTERALEAARALASEKEAAMPGQNWDAGDVLEAARREMDR